MSETKRDLADAAVVRAYNRQRSTAARRRVDGDLKTPEIILGERLAEIRSRQSLTAEQFAEQVAELGGPRLDRATISRVESGNRGVSLNEALIFAAALGVAPVNLFVPTADGTYNPVQLTSEIEAPSPTFRDWVRGAAQLPGLDVKPFVTEIPDSEWKQQQVEEAADVERFRVTMRRWRVLKAKARQVSEDLAELEQRFARTADQVTANQVTRLSARLEACYDEVAEATVETEDAYKAITTRPPELRAELIRERYQERGNRVRVFMRDELTREPEDTEPSADRADLLQVAMQEARKVRPFSKKPLPRSVVAAAEMLKSVIAKADAGEDDDDPVVAFLRQEPKELKRMRSFVRDVEALEADSQVEPSAAKPATA